jgi:cytochrome b involved in lipid metabolism
MKSNKKTILIASSIIVIVVAGVSFALYSSNKNAYQKQAALTAAATTTTTGERYKNYTLADIAKHSAASNCWTTVDSGVYDLTEWIAQHPGGATAILGMCGKDGSEDFNEQHGGQRRPASELAAYKIGVLAQ